MADLFGRIRSGAEKAAFEAEKLRRVQGVQGEIRSLKQEAEQQIYRVGRTAFSLYGGQQIDNPRLQQVCKRLADLQDNIAAKEKTVEDIKAEIFRASVAAEEFGHICPNGHGALPLQDKFCQVCGATAIDVAAPAAAASCASCGSELSANARFCYQCGHEVAGETAVEEKSEVCQYCGEPLQAGAVFCISCGQKNEPGGQKLSVGGTEGELEGDPTAADEAPRALNIESEVDESTKEGELEEE